MNGHIQPTRLAVLIGIAVLTGAVSWGAALIYDKQGKTWVYTAPEPLTFMRTKVVVAEAEGNQVTLSEGPPPGTKIVTQGVTQVYGAELGMAGKH